jgi:hypothetical protein
MSLEHILIILTTTVNVTPNTAFQINKSERINTYLKSINHWLTKTEFKIVLIENSGYEFNELHEEKILYKNRFEIITYNEKDIEYTGYQMHLASKGGLEINSIHYAYNNSKLLQNITFIIKITGRFFIPEFDTYLNNLNLNQYDCLKQYFNNRCEIVGSHIKNFNIIFNKNLFIENGIYDYHIENVYDYRYTLFKNVLVCPIFNIELTQRGGLNEKYSQL